MTISTKVYRFEQYPECSDIGKITHFRYLTAEYILLNSNYRVLTDLRLTDLLTYDSKTYDYSLHLHVHTDNVDTPNRNKNHVPSDTLS